MIDKEWRPKKICSNDDISRLQAEMGINEPLAILLLQRGIKNKEQALKFINPDINDLHDPFLMKDMEKAVVRLRKAIDEKEKILVYGDYDVDGATSVAMMYLFLLGLYESIGFYIPDRYSEGYGISLKGIDYAADNGFTLIIALDCGIKSAEKIEYAKQKDIDFIICDHHKADEFIPDACAVLDPKQPECKYPFKELSGCGVGFKLMQAYAQKNNIPFSELIPFLDLVVVSIASDIVPITGENRALAFLGLKRINEAPSIGLKAIIDVSGLKNKDIKIDDIVFKIGPRLNASGRMYSGATSVELLISNDIEAAAAKAKEINSFNNERRDVDLSITEEALNMIAGDKDLERKKTTVLYNPKWNKGVVGIVASRLIETYYRPTVILTESNEFVTGSARSVEGYDLYEALCKCSGLLENFGGHMYAAGLTIRQENLEEFIQQFEKVVSETIKPEHLIPKIEFDAQLLLKDITPEFFNLLKKLEPFGPGNMSPVFYAEDVCDDGNARIVGENKTHLKLCVVQDEKTPVRCHAIAFSMAQHYSDIAKGNPFEILFSISENNYMGYKSIQLNIKAIRK